MNIYSHKDFRKYVKGRLSQLPGKEKELKTFAAQTKIHVTQVTQILNGKREPTLDQAFMIANYLKLDSDEQEFFLTLVQLERATNIFFREYLLRHLSQIKERVTRQNSPEKLGLVFGPQQQEIFFSTWYYSAIYLMTSIPKMGDVDKVSKKLDLPRDLVRQVLEFLVQSSLCTQENGEFQMRKNELSAMNHPSLRDRHRLNWRLKASEAIFQHKKQNLFFTNNISISRKDAENITAWIDDLQNKIDAVVAKTQPEVAICYNYDWFEIGN
jgi:uncharacterized protein (TIGR02147 family)